MLFFVCLSACPFGWLYLVGFPFFETCLNVSSRNSSEIFGKSPNAGDDDPWMISLSSEDLGTKEAKRKPRERRTNGRRREELKERGRIIWRKMLKMNN